MQSNFLSDIYLDSFIKTFFANIFQNPIEFLMMKVLTQPVLKLKYFDCKKGAGHEGEVLNYVCI